MCALVCVCSYSPTELQLLHTRTSHSQVPLHRVALDLKCILSGTIHEQICIIILALSIEIGSIQGQGEATSPIYLTRTSLTQVLGCAGFENLFTTLEFVLGYTLHI